MDKTLSEIVALIKSPGKSILTTHLNPDIDSAASCLVLADVLREYGHEVAVFSQDPLNDYSFLKGFSDITISDMDSIRWETYDIFWAVDQADAGRCGMTLPFPKNLNIVNIDHHATNTQWGKLNLVDAKAASTCSILLGLFEAAEINLDDDRATMLMGGLAGDTGFFEYFYPNMFTEASTLLQNGADYQTIRFHMLQQNTEEDMRYLTNALESLKVYPEEKVVIVHIPYSITVQYGDEVKRGLISNYTQVMQGTNFGVVLTEVEDGSIRMSLRARNQAYDVSRIAREFGGGGHTVAAGARVKGMTMDELTEKILALA